MPYLSNCNYATIQAGVWIITDNLNYDQLSSLHEEIISYHPNGGIRRRTGSQLINRSDINSALNALRASGINVENKAIWRSVK